ncbi:MAG: NUDIX hydrolase [Magnetococcales bacterium]|nr:NUDIX hydrolase [Magnetococcales bacterium]
MQEKQPQLRCDDQRGSSPSDPLAAYRQMRREQPQLFRNPKGPVGTEIVYDARALRLAEQGGVDRMKQLGVPESWARLGLLYQNEFFSVLRDPVRFSPGRYGIYIRVVMNPAMTPGSVVLPLYRSQVVMVEQFRHATRDLHLELPRGFGSPRLTPEETACQEVQEEIEGRVVRLESLGMMHTNTGVTDEQSALFFAELDEIGSVQEEEGIVRLRLFDVEEVERLIADGTITDAFTLCAMYRARLRKLL